MALTNGITSKVEFLDAVKFCDMLVGIMPDYVAILKNRYGKTNFNLTNQELQELGLDFILKSMSLENRRVFSEAFKIEVKKKLQEIIREYGV